ncbi:MAG: tetratricopeptide repeat protein [Burkholderiales bacterium]
MVADTAEDGAGARVTRRPGPTRFFAAALLATAGAFAADKEPQCGEIAGNPELAVKVCTRLIEFAGLDRPDLASAYYTRGSEWASLGNHERAIMDFELAIQLDPKPAHYFNRALSLSERGDHERAIADYGSALKLAPGDVGAYVGRAVEWTLLGEYKRAQADYDEVIRREPKGLAGYFGRGRVRFYAGDFMLSASDLIRAHQLDPSVYTALWLFLARKRAGIHGEQTLEQEAAVTGSWPDPVVALYLAKSTPEAVQKGAAHADPTRQRDQRCEANFYVAQWHLLRGQHDAAYPLLRQALSGCRSTFVEHEGAVAEVRRVQK